MLRSLPTLSIGLATLLTSLAAFALNNDVGSDDRNYRVIVDRNPFALKPPPPPPTNAPIVLQPKDEILLTGITSIGSVRAYFMTKPPQGKNPEYYSLGVDEKKNGLEVLDIDTSGKSVKVRNGGVEAIMTFASHGVKPPAVPNAAPPGAQGPAGSPPPMPGAVVPPGGHPTATVLPGNASTPVATAGTGRVRSIPSRNVRTPPVNINPGMEQAMPTGRADPNAGVQDVLLMELQKRANPNITFPPTPGLPE